MNNYLLVINAGSSSIKFAVYQVHSSSRLVKTVYGQIEAIGLQPRLTIKLSEGELLVDKSLANSEVNNHFTALTVIRSWLLDYLKDGVLLAIGHRVVHGGSTYSCPVQVNEKIVVALEAFVPFAPLHQPHNLSAIRVFQAILPTVPQVACFDSAFHCTQPAVAQRFALPGHFYDEGVRRYGFHGLSYEYINSILPELDPDLTQARIIIAHLGNGASLCALQNGCSIATTMGFSPLDGLVMGTRCGSIDPGVLLYLMDHHGMDRHALEQLLYHESGLLGVSSISGDLRTLLDSEEEHAKQAIELFIYRIVREIGSLVAALGGLDALVFTAGIGENSSVIREKISQQCVWLGLELDGAANEAGALRISSAHSKVSVWRVATDESLMIAQHSLLLVTSAEN